MTDDPGYVVCPDCGRGSEALFAAQARLREVEDLYANLNASWESARQRSEKMEALVARISWPRILDTAELSLQERRAIRELSNDYEERLEGRFQ